MRPDKFEVIAIPIGVRPNLIWAKSADEFLSDKEQLARSGSRYLVFIGAKGCYLCKQLLGAFERLSNESEWLTESPICRDVNCLVFEVGEVDDLRQIGLGINSFPTVLGYTGQELIAGWQGFLEGANNDVSLSVAIAILQDFCPIT